MMNLKTTALLGNLGRQNVSRQLMPLTNSKNTVLTLSQRTTHPNAPRTFSSSQTSRDNNNNNNTNSSSTYLNNNNNGPFTGAHQFNYGSAFSNHALGHAHTSYIPPAMAAQRRQQQQQTPLTANINFYKDHVGKESSKPRYNQISRNAWEAMDGQNAQDIFPLLQEMRHEGYYADLTLSSKIVSRFLAMNAPKDAARALVMLMECHGLQGRPLSYSQRNTYSALAKDIVNHTSDLYQALSLVKLLDRHGLSPSSGLADGTLRTYRQVKAASGLDAIKSIINSSDVETLLSIQASTIRNKTRYKSLIEILLDAKEMNIIPSQEACWHVSTSFKAIGDFTGQLAWDTAVQEIYPGYNASAMDEAQAALNNSNSNNNNRSRQQKKPFRTSNEITSPKCNLDGVHAPLNKGENLSEAIRTACRFGNAHQALENITLMIRDNQMPSPQAIAETIQVCAKREKERKTDYHQLFQLAQLSLDSITDKEERRAVEYEILNAMLVANATRGDMVGAKSNYDSIVQLGQFPDATSYATLLIATTTGAVDEANDALRILDEVKRHNVKPNIFFYNVVIGKLSRGRKIERVLEVYEEMIQHHIRPNAITYGTLISAYTRVGSEEMAKNLFQEMVSAPKYNARHGPHNAMIQFYVRQKKDRKAALMYYEDMLQRQLTPTEHTYTLLIEAHACIQPYDLAEANRLIQSMKQGPVRPSEMHYGALIHAYGVEHRDLSSAEKVFQNMRNSGLVPKGPAYQSLIESYITDKQIEKAVETRNQLLRSGQPSNAYIENTLIRGYGQCGDITSAEKIFESMEDPHGAHASASSTQQAAGQVIIKEPSTYQSMVTAYLENNMMDRAYEALARMRRQQYPELVIKPVEEAIHQATVTLKA
ncbi:hypothetical protein BGZ94_006999 [Podila epigama]|nr:hypothetical protein BGZ94_006999 [Podila epigama]